MLKRKAAEEKELAPAVKKLKTPLEQKVNKPPPEGEKKKRKKRKKRDPTQPKKPLTAFFVYLSRRTERLKAKNPHLKHKEIIALAGRTFKELKPEARAVYEAAAKELAELYQKEFAEWKANQPEQPEQPEEANPGEDVASSDKRDGKRKRKKRDEEKKGGSFDPLVSGSSDLDAPLAAEDAGSRASSLGGASAEECLGGPDHVASHEIVERTASDSQVRLASTTSNRP